MRITEEALCVVKVNEKTKLKVRNMGKAFYMMAEPFRIVGKGISHLKNELFDMYVTEEIATHHVANMLIDELVDSGKGSIVVAFGEPSSLFNESAYELLKSDSVYVGKNLYYLSDNYKYRESLRRFRDRKYALDGYMIYKKLDEYFKKYKGVEFEDCIEELKGRRDLKSVSCGFRLTLVKK